MATAKQIAANRRNAQKSRGPVTEAGKKIACRNALVHGLCAPFQVLPHVENQSDFDALLEAFIAAEKPTDAVEHELVIAMAEQFWLAKRATRMQNTGFLAQEPTAEQKKHNDFPIRVQHEPIQIFMRYHTAHYRAYRQAMQDLQNRRKQKQLQDIGSVRQKQAEAEEVRCEKRQIQRDEHHAASMRLQKTKEEIAHCRLMKVSHDVAKLFQGLTPPDFASICA